jgi:TolA-binding protein
MKFSRMLVSGFMLTGLLLFPRQLPAQSEKVMIQELQRDVAQLQNQIRQSKEAQDQKNAELEALLKQSLDSNAKLAASLSSLQQSLTSSMADQQGKLVQPVNAVGIKVDQLSQSLSSLETNMDAMTRRMASQDGKLTEILNNLKTLSNPPAAPPPSSVPGGGGTASTGSTVGASADVAFQNAYRDFMSGLNQLAMDEFRNFIAQFPTSPENAPKAAYYIGVLYDRDQDYENAVKAYDAVLERYPENPTTRDALYGKAVALMKLDHKVESTKEFRAFLAKYPTDDKVAQVNQYLKEMNGPAHAPVRSQKGKR